MFVLSGNRRKSLRMVHPQSRRRNNLQALLHRQPTTHLLPVRVQLVNRCHRSPTTLTMQLLLTTATASRLSTLCYNLTARNKRLLQHLRADCSTGTPVPASSLLPQRLCQAMVQTQQPRHCRTNQSRQPSSGSSLLGCLTQTTTPMACSEHNELPLHRTGPKQAG